MKILLILALVAALQTYTATQINPANLVVGYSEIVGSGESRAANIGIRNDTKQPLKNVVVVVKMKFDMSNKGGIMQGERSEYVEVKSLAAGATHTATIKFHDKVVRLTSAQTESVIQKK